MKKKDIKKLGKLADEILDLLEDKDQEICLAALVGATICVYEECEPESQMNFVSNMKRVIENLDRINKEKYVIQ